MDSRSRLSVLLLLWSHQALAYRTASDLPEFAGTERVRWETDTIHYNRSQWLPPGLSSGAVDQAVAQGFASWAGLACPTVTFVDDGPTSSVAAPGDGRVTVQWISHDWQALGFDANAAASTDVHYEQQPGGFWRITDADIYLNGAGSFTWTTDGADPTARDVQAVIAHEVGHVIGLLHPCELDGADGAPVCTSASAGLTMYPEYSFDQRTLEPDDIAGACFLYTPPACAAEACPDGMVCTIEGCGLPCDADFCLAGERCGPLGCTTEPCAAGSCERGCEDTCSSSGGADADPCSTDTQCYGGHCSTAGYCAPLCSDGVCPQGFTCDLAAVTQECVADQGVFGSACGSGEDCSSGECLIENDVPKMCTRPCGSGARDCPEGFSCESVHDVDVCVPPAGSGCAVGASPGGHSGHAGAWVVLFAVALAGALRPRRRGSR